MYKETHQVGVNRWDSQTSLLRQRHLHTFINLFLRLPSETLSEIKHYGLFALQISLQSNMQVIPEQITLYLLGVCDKTGFENRNPLSDSRSN